MLFNFLEVWLPIKSTITISNSKAFKNKSIILKDSEIKYLKDIFNILNIFISATTKLQADKYPTICYLIPLIYSIYNKLNNIRITYQVSIKYSLFSYKFINNIINL
jgi:hypothetical protein